MSLKMVKQSVLRMDGDKQIITHYEIDIFVYDTQTRKAECLKNCSMTSNRMIQRAIEFFNPVEVIEKHAEKWSYSRPLGIIKNV